MLLPIVLLAPLVVARTLPSTTKYTDQKQCRSFREDFNQPDLVDIAQYTNQDDVWISEFGGAYTTLQNGVLNLEMVKSNYFSATGLPMGREATVSFSRWFTDGQVCARIKSGYGAGVVSAMMIDSYTPGYSVDDEIDFEWLGAPAKLNNAETAYFNLGVEDHTNGGIHPLNSTDVYNNWHTYCIDRLVQGAANPSQAYIKWSVDGKTIRTVTPATAPPGKIPSKPSKIVFTIWDGGSGAQGVMEWAGGRTDWSQDRFPDKYRMQVDWVEIKCFGESATTTQAPSTTSQAPSTTSQATTEAVVTSKPSSATPTKTGSVMPTPSVNINDPNAPDFIVRPSQSSATKIIFSILVLLPFLM